MTLPAPNACRHCGIDEQQHGRRYTPDEVGGHYWTAPDDVQRLERMQARRAATRKDTTMPDFEPITTDDGRRGLADKRAADGRPETKWLRIDIGDHGVVFAIGETEADLADSAAEGVRLLLTTLSKES